jgi:translation elongation factor EF-G
MTAGRGRFEVKHSHYDPVPSHLVAKLTADREPARTA